MKRLITLISLSGLLSLGLFFGCSDDESNPTGGNLNPGDTTTETFQFIDSTFDGEYLGGYEESFQLTLAAMEQIPGLSLGSRAATASGLGAMSPNDTVEVTQIASWEFTDDNWLVINYSATAREIDGTDTSEVTIDAVDSVQFLLNGQPLDSTAVWLGTFNGLATRQHGDVSGSEGDNSFTGAAHRALELEVVPTNDSLISVGASLDDTLTFDVADDSGSCALELTSNQTVTDLVVMIDDDDECPRAGTIVAIAGIDLSCQSNDGLAQLDIEGSWTISATVNADQSITLSYSDGTTTWTVTRNCDDL